MSITPKITTTTTILSFTNPLSVFSSLLFFPLSSSPLARYVFMLYNMLKLVLLAHELQVSLYFICTLSFRF